MKLFSYTHENHFQFGYRNSSTQKTQWLDRRVAESEKFVARYGRAETEEKSWRNANTTAAVRILESAVLQQLTPVVCFSGGLDSEITLLSFFAAWSSLPTMNRPPLEIATLDFEGELNRHDTQYVEKFLFKYKRKDLDLSFRRYSLDIQKFMASPDFVQLADEAQVISPAVVAQLWLCQEIHRANTRALPVIGQGEMHLVRAESPAGTYEPATWSLVETENLCGLYRFFIGRGLPAVPGFFQYMPEQFETQLRTNSVIHELISNSRIGKLGTRTSKAEILAFEYPELEARPKYTGFEKIEALYDERRSFLLGRPLANEAKCLQPVFDLYADLRPTAHAPVRVSDWNFAWGRDGIVTSVRTSPDDIFATQWNDPSLLKTAFEKSSTATASTTGANSGTDSSAVGPRDFLSAISSYLKLESSNGTALSLLHDGSPTARLFHCILKREFGITTKCVLPRSVQAPSETKLVKIVLNTGNTDPEIHTRLTFAHTTSSESDASPQTRVLLPFLHGRIVNAEFDRELESTLIRPRFVWTENESLATLTAALESDAQIEHARAGASSTRRLICPWTDSSLAKALIHATRSTGWFSADEPGPSNRTDLEKFFDQCLEILEESSEERELAAACAREYTELKSEVGEGLAKISMTSPRFQVSSYDLQSYSTEPFNLAPILNQILVADLKVVSEETWLTHAKMRARDLRLGANLFFQQNVSGFALLEKNQRIHFALTTKYSPKNSGNDLAKASDDEVAWAQLIVQKSAPNGKLRIRGVTTRPDCQRKGYATELLSKICTHLRANANTHLKGFSSVDVYAAPEVVKAFRSAGFNDDVSRVTRNEEVVDPETGQLVASDRELTSLTFPLGET